jgi:Protein of unknown function (DUF2752)
MLRAQALVIAIGVPLGLLVLALIQPEQLDDLPGLCVWKRVTGRPCFGCGTTHAVSALMHGDLSAAARYNRIVFIVVPVGVWIWLAQLRILWAARTPKPIVVEADSSQTNGA